MNRQGHLITNLKVKASEVEPDQRVLTVESVESLLGAFAIEKPDYSIAKEITAGMIIKHLRESINMRQNDLATKADIGPSVISRIENTDYSVGYNVLNRILKAMNMDWQDWADSYQELENLNQ